MSDFAIGDMDDWFREFDDVRTGTLVADWEVPKSFDGGWRVVEAFTTADEGDEVDSDG